MVIVPAVWSNTKVISPGELILRSVLPDTNVQVVTSGERRDVPPPCLALHEARAKNKIRIAERARIGVDFFMCFDFFKYIEK
jgi:hypothetical protein